MKLTPRQQKPTPSGQRRQTLRRDLLPPVAATAPVPIRNNCHWHRNTSKAPSDEGAGFLHSKKTRGENRFFFLSLRLRLRRIHLPHQREAGYCGAIRDSVGFCRAKIQYLALTSGLVGGIIAPAMWCNAPEIVGPLAQLVRAGGS